MIERLLAGEAAFERGELDVAARLYGQVAEADPKNAIALVGSARVAARRGEVAQARELAGLALAIDPDEAAARRLLDELDAPSLPSEPVVRPELVMQAEPVQAIAPRAPGLRAWLARLLRRR